MTPTTQPFSKQPLSQHNLAHYRARVMRLVSGDFVMKFHRDAAAEKWRIHVPIETNPNSYFEWKLPDGSITTAHFPADGSAWFVRVDHIHRATNEGPTSSQRVHLLMSLSKKPLAEAIDQPFRLPSE